MANNCRSRPLTGLAIQSRDPESGLNQNYINPFWLTKTSFVTAKKLATHQKDFLHQLRGLLVFIEFHILICIHHVPYSQHHSNSPSQSPGEVQRQEKGCYPGRPHTPQHPRILLRSRGKHDSNCRLLLSCNRKRQKV